MPTWGETLAFICDLPGCGARGQTTVYPLAEVLEGNLVLFSHAAGRETINALHCQIGGVVGGDRVPDAPTMRRLMSEAGLSEISVLDAPTLYLATARRECGHPPTG